MSLDGKELGYNDPLSSLSAWVIGRVDQWEEHRNTNYLDKWDEYYRIWRGIWASEDKTRGAENSKLISPATQQAIESTVAELEEAVFGGGTWFDLRDDVADQNPTDAAVIKTNLTEDLEREKVKNAIVECLLNAAIYGTGIGKINVVEKTELSVEESPIADTLTTDTVVVENEVVRVTLEALTPKEFVIDPTGTSIDEALGAAQIVIKPKYEIMEGIRDGIYEDKPIGSYDKMDLGFDDENSSVSTGDDKVKITEYWGRVPKKFLTGKDSISEEFDYDEDDLVEAVVTIANDKVVLRATENPYLMKDRPFIAFQLDRVPNKFWGRGIAEKGYNPQKALDAELRARIDTLALTTHPMMGVDATRLPRGVKFEVKAGKTILTNGDPRQTLMPLNFGSLAQSSFTEAAELERMVQMGTGAMDSATSINGNARNATASGMSMIQGASIKRQKRTIMNFSENFLIPFIEKATWRYIQFVPERYPTGDYKFVAMSSMGVMAKEMETMQMIQLLSMTQQGSPAFGVLLMGIFDNSSMPNREELKAAIAQQMQPDPQEQQMQQMMKQLTLMKAQMEIKEIEAGITKDYAEVAKIQDELGSKQSEEYIMNASMDLAKKMGQIENLRKTAQNIESETMRNIPEVEHLQSETILNLAMARAKALGK